MSGKGELSQNGVLLPHTHRHARTQESKEEQTYPIKSIDKTSSLIYDGRFPSS